MKEFLKILAKYKQAKKIRLELHKRYFDALNKVSVMNFDSYKNRACISFCQNYSLDNELEGALGISKLECPHFDQNTKCSGDNSACPYFKDNHNVYIAYQKYLRADKKVKEIFNCRKANTK